MEKEFIKRYGWTLLGIVAGMVGGYLYWRYVEVAPLGLTLSLLLLSTVPFGGGNGGLLLSSFMPEHRKIRRNKVYE